MGNNLSSKEICKTRAKAGANADAEAEEATTNITAVRRDNGNIIFTVLANASNQTNWILQ